jgi:hypothetical protein
MTRSRRVTGLNLGSNQSPITRGRPGGRNPKSFHHRGTEITEENRRALLFGLRVSVVIVFSAFEYLCASGRRFQLAALTAITLHLALVHRMAVVRPFLPADVEFLG